MSLHIFECLTRPEWKLCYTLVSLLHFEGYKDSYPIDDYATPGLEGETSNVEELFRRAARFLALEVGMEFEGLHSFEASGSFKGLPIERRNLVYLEPIRVGHVPSDLVHSARVAVAVANEKAPGLDTRPIEEFLYEQANIVDRVVGQADPQETGEEIERSKEALKHLGITTEVN